MAAPHVAWKRRVGRLFRIFSARRPRSVVLIYHAVASGPASLPLERFREQVAWLARNVEVVSIDGILAPARAAGLRVALSFDDGYACLARTVAPILRQAGMSATVFLNTACISDSGPIASDASKGHTAGEEFLLWNEVDALYRMGWTIGSHGADHVDLTQLPDPEIRRQLQQSKAEIERRLGTECRHFAYTWGNHDRHVRAAVAQCGYESAFAGVHGAVQPSRDRYAISRIDVRADYELEDFIAVVRGDWDYLGLIQQARRLLQ
jgi:peptidoglycan/xylan/chitin deacetylase (PgdA/CDA1 family)